MRAFRQKVKKTLPQNKRSRDESSLLRCNSSSMAGSAAHGCFICHGLRRKKTTKNTYNITTAKKYALHCWWTVLTPPCSLDRLIQPWTRYYTGAGRARHGSVCFEATSFFSFWRKSLISESLWDSVKIHWISVSIALQKPVVLHWLIQTQSGDREWGQCLIDDTKLGRRKFTLEPN